MPEGDTIAYAAKRMRPVLEGHVPDEIRTPHPRHALDRWPERLAGRAVTEIRTHGKHLFLAFEGDLTIHSHLRMTGSWATYEPGRRWRRSPRRAWLILERAGHQVVEFDGPVLELLTDSRTRFDQRLAALGPDILADTFDAERFLARLRRDDPTRGIGDALLDQRNRGRDREPVEVRELLGRRRGPVAPRQRGERRGGSGRHRSRAPADVRVGAHRPPGRRPAGLSPARRAVRALRRRQSAPAARATTTGQPSGVRVVSADASRQGRRQSPAE